MNKGILKHTSTPNFRSLDKDSSITTTKEEHKYMSGDHSSDLGLSNNKISDTGVEYFCTFLSSGSTYSQKLVFVDLTYNRITKTGERKLHRVLTKIKDIQIGI